METKFYTDGKGIYKIHKTTIVLSNLETSDKVETKILDDGTIKGFSVLNLNQVEQSTKEPVKIEPTRRERSARKLSKFWGVSAADKGKFRVQAYINGKQCYGGCYDDEDEAAHKADELLVQAGLLAKNFPGLPVKLAKNIIFSCVGCGENYGKKPDKCEKCNGTSFEPLNS